MNGEMNLYNPTALEMSRSTRSYHPTVTGSCLAGRLYPAISIDILPGDSVKMDLRSLFKMSTPVYPTMDALYADVFFFFVPNKLVLGRRYGTPDVNNSNQSWDAFIGAQDNLLNMPVPASGIVLPGLKIGASAALKPGSLGDYLGYPVDDTDQVNGYPAVGATLSKIDCLDTLSYFAIWNENFTNPNGSQKITWGFTTPGATDGQGRPSVIEVYPAGVQVLSPLAERTTLGRGTQTGDYEMLDCIPVVSGQSYSDDFMDWVPLPVCRFHGYFGSALPWPQRNTAGVEIPLGSGMAPVYTGVEHNLTEPNFSGLAAYALHFKQVDGNANFSTGDTPRLTSGGNMITTASSNGTEKVGILPNNLYANLDEARGITVNAFRALVAQQRWYEHLSRSGNRPDELEFGLFGVRPHDSGDDRPLYLGGKRIPLNIEMVASTNGGSNNSAAAGSSSLGSLGAFSHTNDSDHYFYHSFDAWGKLMCVFCIRHHDTFSQGIRRGLTRMTREEYYFPTFAFLGEQPIRKAEIYAGVAAPDSVFGYQEAWEEYRQEPDRVVGLVRPDKSLGFMTYAEHFEGGSISLNTWLNASTQVSSIDKTLQVKSVASGFQFVYQFTFDYTMRRCMPDHSIPGFVDHF